MTLDDVDALHEVLGDADAMRYYPHPFSRDDVLRWVVWNVELYERYGFGLWTLVLKGSGEVVGDTGLTMQEVDGERLVEVGWHVIGRHQRRGFATEAGRACRDMAFGTFDVERLISLIRPENVPSRRVAEKLGMGVWKETVHGGLVHLVYSLDRDTHRELAAGGVA